MLLVDDLAAGGTKNLRHTPRGLVTLVMHLKENHLITSRAADDSENASILKIISHNINRLCVHHNSELFKHI